ncbi:Vacuolar protein sorting-associated protein 29 [Dimargaris xerosporica]|nr:Vacuolar protein sorting-associated protein 29 [Dimargaris xerosporica]
MVLLLAIGDLHIPQRASNLPASFRRLLVPGKIQQILCTGNVCDRETFEYLRSVAAETYVVKGDADDPLVPWPQSKIVQHGDIRVGVIHGHQLVPSADSESLAIVARQMDVDILITGHTHRFEAFEYDGKFFVNPGSATGAYGAANIPPTTAATPSFVLMDIQPTLVTTYVYQLVDGELKVDKIEYKKE